MFGERSGGMITASPGSAADIATSRGYHFAMPYNLDRWFPMQGQSGVPDQIFRSYHVEGRKSLWSSSKEFTGSGRVLRKWDVDCNLCNGVFVDLPNLLFRWSICRTIESPVQSSLMMRRFVCRLGNTRAATIREQWAAKKGGDDGGGWGIAARW